MICRFQATPSVDHFSHITQIRLIAGPFVSPVGAERLLAYTDHSLPASAFLAKGFGTRRIYLISLPGFTRASVLCAFMPSAGFLIAACSLQNVVDTLLLPLTMNVMLRRSVQRRRLLPTVGTALFHPYGMLTS
jgi:MFS family permease